MALIRRANFAVAISLALLAAVPAFATSSNYLLTLGDVKGESSTIEVASWSFGASNPTSIGSSGMSSGRRQHQPPIRLLSPAPVDGEVSVVTAREASSGKATDRCAMGKHFASATLSHLAQTWALTDVTISTCAAEGMTLSYRSAQEIPQATDGAKVTKSRSNIQNN